MTPWNWSAWEMGRGVEKAWEMVQPWRFPGVRPLWVHSLVAREVETLWLSVRVCDSTGASDHGGATAKSEELRLLLCGT